MVRGIPYFAYGSNLNLAGMARRTPRATRGVRATLPDWRLTFRGVADIERAEGEDALGALWYLDTEGIAALDRYEGYPTMYDREWVTVRLDDGRKVRAITYVMTEPKADLSPPSSMYLTTIRDGFKAWGLDVMVLDGAVAKVYRDNARMGITEYVPKGKKRLVPKPKRRRAGTRDFTTYKWKDGGWSRAARAGTRAWGDDLEPPIIRESRDEDGLLAELDELQAYRDRLDDTTYEVEDRISEIEAELDRLSDPDGDEEPFAAGIDSGPTDPWWEREDEDGDGANAELYGKRVA